MRGILPDAQKIRIAALYRAGEAQLADKVADIEEKVSRTRSNLCIDTRPELRKVRAQLTPEEFAKCLSLSSMEKPARTPAHAKVAKVEADPALQAKLFRYGNSMVFQVSSGKAAWGGMEATDISRAAKKIVERAKLPVVGIKCVGRIGFGHCVDSKLSYQSRPLSKALLALAKTKTTDGRGAAAAISDLLSDDKIIVDLDFDTTTDATLSGQFDAISTVDLIYVKRDDFLRHGGFAYERKEARELAAMKKAAAKQEANATKEAAKIKAEAQAAAAKKKADAEKALEAKVPKGLELEPKARKVSFNISFLFEAFAGVMRKVNQAKKIVSEAGLTDITTRQTGANGFGVTTDANLRYKSLPLAKGMMELTEAATYRPRDALSAIRDLEGTGNTIVDVKVRTSGIDMRDVTLVWLPTKLYDKIVELNAKN